MKINEIIGSKNIHSSLKYIIREINKTPVD